ncbi:methyltransferase [uncultured Paraglaciecola sp.]|uniref:tRNA1(Val) (adenine(37)-N6)-methyltransferase n=1 Tax=uncultured Paraglaciecola sp. TaxID=1765024 RepID=UPI0026100C9B|nr:methyltransferase [uncultured Paraglaciecola sp.]
MGFKFKQFTIEDQACGMKVGTDSIMLGSWVQTNHPQRILDIGTGSGLLAIMLAQKTPESCLIDGIDLDAAAIKQAKINGQNCPWTQRLTFYHTSLQNFQTDQAYDLIISNPPYFCTNKTANKTQTSPSRTQARQTVALDHATLLQAVAQHLSVAGQFNCVLPESVAHQFIDEAQTLGLHCTRALEVQPKQDVGITRLLLAFKRTKTPTATENISIYNQLNEYSTDYIALCKDYYLNF